MSVLRHYDCITLCIRILGSLVCNIRLISDLCLVLCCDTYRSTFISIMYPACMITVHDRKSRVLQTGVDVPGGPAGLGLAAGGVQCPRRGHGTAATFRRARAGQRARESG